MQLLLQADIAWEYVVTHYKFINETFTTREM